MNSLNILRSVLYKLKKEEVKSLINFLKYHQKQVKDQSLKSIKLVKLLLSKRDISSNDLQLLLYKKLNYHAFTKLINRLKDKIYEIILFDGNLGRLENYGRRNRAIFDLRKKLLQSEVMYLRGMNDEIEGFQNRIITSAKQYEIYDALIEALQAKQRYLSFRSGSAANLKIKKEIIFFEKSRKAYSIALDIYNSLSAKINFSSSYLDYKDELDQALEKLKADYEETNSSSVGYYYLFLLTEYYQNNSDFSNAQKTLLRLKELLENNIAIYTKFRIGITIVNIANNRLLMYDFKDSLLHSKDALHFFSDSVVNTGVAKEIEFYALFYSDKITESEQLIEELYHASRTSKTPFLYSKRAYLLACLKTLKGEFNHSAELLSEVSEIEKDKEGWNIGKRILTIINRIEMNDFESVDLQVQNLEKHIKRTLKSKHVRKRNIFILRILLKLINEQFDFQKVYKNRVRYFNLLESDHVDYRWQIKSPELIIFHEWFKSKMENRPYNHVAAIEKEKEHSLAVNS